MFIILLICIFMLSGNAKGVVPLGLLQVQIMNDERKLKKIEGLH